MHTVRLPSHSFPVLRSICLILPKSSHWHGLRYVRDTLSSFSASASPLASVTVSFQHTFAWPVRDISDLETVILDLGVIDSFLAERFPDPVELVFDWPWHEKFEIPVDDFLRRFPRLNALRKVRVVDGNGVDKP